MALTAGLVGNKTAQNGSHVTKTEQQSPVYRVIIHKSRQIE